MRYTSEIREEVITISISSATYQFLNQQPLLRFVDASHGPDGPQGTQSFWLVPTNGYFNGQRAPHTVKVELDAGGYDKTTLEGIEYFLVPEESTNTPGLLSHYAQRTGVADLQNPPGGGVNRVLETFENVTTSATAAPGTVEKYVADNDNFEQARVKASTEDEIIDRAVKKGEAAPAVEVEAAPAKKSEPAKKDSK